MRSIYRSEAGRRAVLDTYRGILAAWPVPNRQYTLATAFGDTFVIESGDPANPALLLLHGSMSNSCTWFGDVRRLGESYHVFAVDLLGEASLSAENRPKYGSSAYSMWLDEVRRKLGLETMSIAGLSLGGWMALRYATVHPERVEKLALLCPAGLARERRGFLWKSMLQKFRGKRGLEMSMRRVMGNSEITEGMRRALEYTALIAEHEKPRMARLYVFGGEELKRLAMPVLVLFGDSDNLLRAEESIRRISEFAPNVRSEILPNTGHAVVGQAERILAFLRSI